MPAGLVAEPAPIAAKYAWIMPGPAPGTAVMELAGTDLGCVRGGRRVFSGVNFTVVSSKPMVLTGANGAGKSSLLRLIAGLIRPAEGAVALNGGDPELSVGEQAHYVGHLDPLKPALTVTENLTFWVRFLNGEAPPGHAIRCTRRGTSDRRNHEAGEGNGAGARCRPDTDF